MDGFTPATVETSDCAEDAWRFRAETVDDARGKRENREGRAGNHDHVSEG